jgi:hypothetical protein
MRRFYAGQRLQHGTPWRSRSAPALDAQGVLLRGVVVATYVTDDDNHPAVDPPTGDDPVAVYCDVLVYSSIPGQRLHILRQVLVSQPFGGMHTGMVWKPKATTASLVDDLDINGGSVPAYFDGDHVLVGFLDNDMSLPVVLRALPHPSLDFGNEDKESGQRMKMTLVDGAPLYLKNRGTVFGVTDTGDAIIDTRYAHDGEFDDVGQEPAPATDGSVGHQIQRLALDSVHTVELQDMSDVNPVTKTSQTITRDGVNVRVDESGARVTINLEEGATLIVEGCDAGASVLLGDGAVSVAVADHLQSLYTALETAFKAHVHPTSQGPSGPTTTVPPTWDARIQSNKLKIPDTD